MSIESHILKSLKFFANFKQHELEAWAAALKSRAVEAGEVIIEKGTPALTFFIILSGTFKVDFEEGRSMTCERKGDVMGWSTVVGPFSYIGTITAQEEGEVLEISSRDFVELIQKDNALGEKIMQKINKIISKTKAIAAGSK